MKKEWEDAIHFPMQRCSVCTKRGKCVRVFSVAVAVSFICEACYKSPLTDLVQYSFTINEDGTANPKS